MTQLHTNITQEEINKIIIREKNRYTIFESNAFPFLSKTTNINNLINVFKDEKCNIQTDNDQYTALFHISNDVTSYITKVFQEQAILNTEVTVKGVTLNSFWNALKHNKPLFNKIIYSKDPQEEIWRQSKKYKYKIPTTFMPSYAKAIYNFDYLNIQTYSQPQSLVVLDPCAGWGDRFLASILSPNVSKYIGFDPNYLLRPGYINIAASCGVSVVDICHDYILFSNDSIIYTLPFEHGSQLIETNSIDFVFTSPPFFNYEIYSKNNPTYSNWIYDFYIPLFVESTRICKPNCFLTFYIDDTSSGKINSWIQNNIEHICPVSIQKNIGFLGVMSKKKRNIWLFKKHA